jgi:phage tail-like protein
MLGKLNSTFDINPLDVNYVLDIDQTQLATFTSLSGGEVELNVIKHNIVYESGENHTLLIPGPTHFSPVILEHGYGNTKELYNWFVLASNGKISSARKNVTITLHAFTKGKYEPLVAWDLINAYPVKISGFESNQSQSARTARFSITIMAEQIERVDP